VWWGPSLPVLRSAGRVPREMAFLLNHFPAKSAVYYLNFLRNGSSAKPKKFFWARSLFQKIFFGPVCYFKKFFLDYH
jgi:hypothetical protein